ncbi:hypothetical protein O9992_21570 [Vibrio lentus]|nr:hypothetical protein [Vibrio lentus]
MAIAIQAKDVPGELDIGAILRGDPLLADGKSRILRPTCDCRDGQ